MKAPRSPGLVDSQGNSRHFAVLNQ